MPLRTLNMQARTPSGRPASWSRRPSTIGRHARASDKDHAAAAVGLIHGGRLHQPWRKWTILFAAAFLAESGNTRGRVHAGPEPIDAINVGLAGKTGEAQSQAPTLA